MKIKNLKKYRKIYYMNSRYLNGRYEVVCIDNEYRIYETFYYRNVRTFQEIKFSEHSRKDAYNNRYKIKGRLRNNIPDNYSSDPGISRKGNKSWKAHTKCRKQWMVNV